MVFKVSLIVYQIVDMFNSQEKTHYNILYCVL